MFFSVAVIIITVVIVSIGLYKFFKYVNSIRSNRSALENIAGREDLEKAVSDELDKFSLEGGKNKEAARTLTKIFDKQLTKKVEAVSKEISNKFEGIIKEKDEQYQAIDEKYKWTLSDKKQTESVIRSIAEGLVVLNDKGEVMMLNPAAEKILGVGLKKQVGQSLSNCLKPEQLVSLVKKTGDAGETEIELVGKNEDTKRVIKSSSAVIENENGKTIGMVSVLTDVTKQKELDEMKSDFVSTVSHELRTPIVAVQTAISLMREQRIGVLNGEQVKFLEVADVNLKRLKRLINDLLDLSKLDAKKTQLYKVKSSIEKAIKNNYETFEPWAKTKGIKIVIDIEKGIPDVLFDFDRIVQVIDNLLSNSIKATAKDGVITIKAAMAASDDKKELIVNVSDTGRGIADEDLPKLFSKFTQVGEKIPLREGTGTGLGLYISKQFIALHGGRIWAESKQGKGSKFIFTLPAED